MKKARIWIVGALAALACALAGPSVAQAHWQNRIIFANGATWAVHYDLAPGTKSIEFFASYGGFFAVPYYADIYNPATGYVSCGTVQLATVFQHHYSISCAGATGVGWRGRIRPPAYWPNNIQVGYYIREI